MRIRTLAVTADFLIDACKGSDERRVRVVENALPSDARFIRAGHDWYGTLYLVIESAEFEDIAENDPIPAHPPVTFEKMYPEAVPA